MSRAPLACLAALLALSAAGPAGAEAPPSPARSGPLDAAAFAALAEGRALSFAFRGEAPYGVERYHAGRRVTYLHLPTGLCTTGRWYAAGTDAAPQICYLYADEPVGPHCFLFFMEDGAPMHTDLGGANPVDIADLGAADAVDLACGHLGS